MNTKDVKKFLAELQQHLNKATDSIVLKNSPKVGFGGSFGEVSSWMHFLTSFLLSANSLNFS